MFIVFNSSGDLKNITYKTILTMLRIIRIGKIFKLVNL